jgi:AIPR protein
MSELHVRQIRAALEKTFLGLIDVSDITSGSAEMKETTFLTRSLAAYALSYAARILPAEAARAVTDGSSDNGLDAVYYHPTDRILYLVQSKWKRDGHGSIERGDLQKFLKGLKDLLNARWDRFNSKISNRKTELDAALDDAATRIALLIAYTGQEAIAPVVLQDLVDVVNEYNDPSTLVTSQVMRQGDLYAAVGQGLEGAPIDLDVALFDFGQTRDPFTSFYGQVSASDVASWYVVHQSRLLAPNLRMFLGSTEVNESIVETLLQEPQLFWYFNNGITAVCRKIQKKPIGGSSRETGIFTCQDLRIVNGAQTVGAISQAALTAPEKVAQARVAIRLISLESSPADFEKRVTRHTNTQNRIDRRDFVALDSEQERLRRELLIEGVTYSFKSGDSIPSAATGFDLVEATVARACQQAESALSVQAKREIGKLWEDLDRPPYRTLFNPGVSGPELWRSVQLLRLIEQKLVDKRTTLTGRARLLTVHGNRFLSHLVFQCLPNTLVIPLPALTPTDESLVQELTERVFGTALGLIESLYPEAYLSSLFKNATKCQALRDAFRCPAPPTQPS